MSINIAPPAKDGSTKGFVVWAPRSSDPISGALRAAFAQQDNSPEDFSALLRRIDLADRATGSC